VHYNSDYVYCERARALGWEIGRVGEVEVRHKKLGSAEVAKQWRAADRALREAEHGNR